MSKYKAKRTEFDGIWFDSKREAARYKELKLLEAAGEIRNLILQPRFNFELNGVKMGFYKADFQYEDRLKDWAIVIEDVKGVKTPVYNIKKKMMRAFHGIEIFETK